MDAQPDGSTMSENRGGNAGEGSGSGPPSGSQPYTTHLNILFPPLEVIDLQPLVDACTDRWYNQTLCQVNDSVVRLGILQGEYHWHKHADLDEFFHVVEGIFFIDLEGRTVELGPRQGFVVPKGVPHRPRAPGRVIVLMVEGAGIVPTGD
jgi:mannose-6-phosphate isomerase-like protein (cupin superfamily)